MYSQTSMDVFYRTSSIVGDAGALALLSLAKGLAAWFAKGARNMEQLVTPSSAMYQCRFITTKEKRCKRKGKERKGERHPSASPHPSCAHWIALRVLASVRALGKKWMQEEDVRWGGV